MKNLLYIVMTVLIAQVCKAQTSSDYFGQTPPGDSAVVFAPDSISRTDRLEAKIAFAPDGNECYFEIVSSGDSSKIYYKKRVNNTWTERVEAPFSATRNVSDPFFSNDGKRLYFTNNYHIYFIERTTGEWGEPQLLPSPINSTSFDWGYTETTDGTAYVTSARSGGIGDPMHGDIWCIPYNSSQAVNLGSVVNSAMQDANPCIAPDGSFLIFNTNGHSNCWNDLFITFNKGNKGWIAPLEMNSCGAKINIHTQVQFSPSLSPDGKFLFFSRVPANPISIDPMDIYWVSTHVIVGLKKYVFAPKLINQIPAKSIKADTVFNYIIPSNAFSCEYGIDSLQYSASLSNGSALPSWLTFNSGTRTLSGTPQQAEIDTIKITATNKDTVSVSCLFRITVTAPDQETVSDIDGNVYQTVTIGTQVWMKENLKTTHYRNGDAIPNITSETAWPGLSTGAYCNYNNDTTQVAVYGRLYNWYAASDSRNVCPTGWHIPTDAEWSTLFTYLGGESIAGGKLKETGTTHWISPNTEATNETGFTALPGGTRTNSGTFFFIGFNSQWWRSTEYDTNNAYTWNVSYDQASIGHSDFSKKSGFSLRCIKDAPAGVDDSQNGKQIPGKFNLNQNYPNPFNPSTIISYRLSVSSNVKLLVYNVLGQKIKTLVNSYQSAGEHTITWNATDNSNNHVSSGVYFYSLTSDASTVQKKMILVR